MLIFNGKSNSTVYIRASHCGQTLFAIIADETRDISGIEQLRIWVDQNYEINEDFVGMVGIESANASNLRSVILDCLLRSNLPLSGCCGQAYRWSSCYVRAFHRSYHSNRNRKQYLFIAWLIL